MLTLKEKILKSTTAFTEEKTRIKEFSEKLSILKIFWKDFNTLLKSFTLSHSNFGKQHLDEADLAEKFLKDSSFTNDFTKILTYLQKFSRSIGGFFNSQSLELNHQQITKFKEQTLLIESLRATFKKNTNQFLDTISKLSSQISIDFNKLENTNREYEAIKNQIKFNEMNQLVDSNNSENALKIVQEKLAMEISAIEGSLLNILTEVSHEQHSLNNLINKFEKDLLLLQNQCLEVIEMLIVSSISLSATLTQFKSEASARINTRFLEVSAESVNQSVGSSTGSFSEHLLESDYKIEVIKYLKCYLKKISMFEDTFEKEYRKSKINPNLYKYFETQPVTNMIAVLQTFEEIFLFHSNYSKALRQDIINPLDTLIRVQSSLNSSIRISIKNISLSFKQAKDHSISDSNIPGVQAPHKISKLEQIKKKEISDLIEDHKAQEVAYLSSAKNITSMFHEINLKLCRDIGELHRNIIRRHNTVSEASEESTRRDCKGEEQKLGLDSLVLLRSTSRNNYLPVVATASSEDEELQRRFSLSEKQSVISSFLCAYLDRILLQGKMYITRTCIYFYSYFNSATFIFNDTLLQVQLSEVISIRKKANLYIFNNSIKIKTVERSYFFTSFLSRDEAFSILSRLLSLESHHSSFLGCPIEINIETRPFRLQLHSALFSVRSPLASMLPSSLFTDEVFIPHIEFGIPIQKLFQLLYSDKSVGFLTGYVEHDGDKVVEIEKWSESAPDFYMGNAGEGWNYSAKRRVRIMHKLRERLPLMPTHCELVENQSIYFVSEEEFVIEVEFEVNAPYGDYFTAYMRWRVTGRDNAVLSARYGMTFNKYTVFQGKILREGTRETMETLRGIWLTLALKAVKQSQGLEAVEVILPKIELKKERESEWKWELWGVILILLLIIVKLLQQISSLEKVILELRHG